MPRVKTPQRLFGMRWAILPELEAHLKKTGETLSIEEAFTLIDAAANPPVLLMHRTAPERVKIFCELYAKRPDFVLETLALIRSKLTKWKLNQEGLVKAFLRSHGPQTRIAIGNSRPVLTDATDGEIAAFLTEQARFAVTAESVKKARQCVTRDDAIFTFSHSKEVRDYMRTGQMTAKLKRMLSERKGTKLAC